MTSTAQRSTPTLLLAPVASGAIRPHGCLRRRGLPTITGPMMAVLIALRTCQQNDDPFVQLPDIDSRTIKALFEREWIAEVVVLGVSHYGITGRGLKSLKVYEPSLKRNDGLCPRCCERPRQLRSTGEPAPYCKECTSRQGKRKYALGLYRLRPQGLCARCHKRPRYVASSGKVYSYCKHCKNLTHRREHKRQREELFIRIIAGEHVPCTREGCDRPRYVSNRTVQDYCHQHYREYQNAYIARRKQTQ